MINYQTKCSLLSELWSTYRFDEDFEQFIDYNDIGLPLAYFLAEGLVTEITQEGQLFVNESFNLFIAALEVSEDEIQENMSLNDLLELAEKKMK